MKGRMEPFAIVTGAAAPLPAANVDTDVIMPKQFLKGIDRSGLAQGAFFDLRFDGERKPRPEFILNRPGWEDARFLVVGPNFGCGSSREHAVWGLAQLGIRALIGTSFAGIFFDNCHRNGILAIQFPEQELRPLLDQAADPRTNQFTIDLPAQTIRAGSSGADGANGAALRFDIDPWRKDALVRGLDAIAVTLESAPAIRDFEREYFAQRPWLLE